ncbi:hypothetical protein [Myxococcus qinghaiensis]|uniref:hypothetical protein n=1 Tax=Myxococcus qinghaiensis TaxID=2906758 RepID=UPI0020A78C11|nr:hypothetical protein [Myxococcus qinghaiensis]MCP3166468.1 hypothetical protein [Myxococcus qinghaiensis]
MNKNARSLVSRLAQTRNLSEAHDFVADLARDHGFQWRPVGDREGNYGLIAMGSDPGHAFVERVTNAVDAIIEREALRRQPKAKSKAMPASPREAVEAWFGVKGGRVVNLPKEPRKDHPKGTVTRQSLAHNVEIILFDSDQKKRPTVEIRDHGIGLTPRLIPLTILSLNETNKVSKPYLAGAYGQGGSTALAFSPQGTTIVSRRDPKLLDEGDKDEVAVTFVRYNELSPEKNKNGRFEYLVGPNNRVVGLPPDEGFDFAPGTSVVHHSLNIDQYSALMTAPTGSMWWLLQSTLFDPVLPVWAEDRRLSLLQKQEKQRDGRTIAGNYTRLMDDKNDKVEWTNSVTVAIEHQEKETSVRVNYWVIKPNPDKPSEVPIAAYVDQWRPIIFTFNGQTHGTEERRFTTDRLGLPYLAKFLIVQVELDHLTSQARRELLSSTRDRLKQSAFYDEMRERILAALAMDETLTRLDEERKERLLSKHSDAEREKMRQRFAKLMDRFKVGADTSAKVKGGTEPGRRPTKPGSRDPLTPLPTQEHPSFIRIANTQRPVPVRLDRHALIRLESDAPDGYITSHIHAKLSVGGDPEGLVTRASASDFSGGRARIAIKPTAKANADQLRARRIILPRPHSRRRSRGKRSIRVFALCG